MEIQTLLNYIKYNQPQPYVNFATYRPIRSCTLYEDMAIFSNGDSIPLDQLPYQAQQHYTGTE